MQKEFYIQKEFTTKKDTFEKKKIEIVQQFEKDHKNGHIFSNNFSMETAMFLNK
jgi:hypothetical protein